MKNTILLAAITGLAGGALASFLVGSGPSPEPSATATPQALNPVGASPSSELEQEVLQGLEQAGLLKRDEVLFTDRSHVRHAYVVFDHDYDRRREVALGWLEQVGIIPLGRFGRFEYDNSDQCVIKARELAHELLPKLVAG